MKNYLKHEYIQYTYAYNCFTNTGTFREVIVRVGSDREIGTVLVLVTYRSLKRNLETWNIMASLSHYYNITGLYGTLRS